MAMEQYFYEGVAQHEEDGDGSPLQKWKTVSNTAMNAADNNVTGCFDCNICLDFAQDPVVTLCGHLYCWPCIYKWIHFQSASTGSEEQQQQQKPQCPVCKAHISRRALVPLYGRGQDPTQTDTQSKAPHDGLKIPRRPPASACGIIHSNPYQQAADPYQHHQRYYPQHYSNYNYSAASYPSPVINLGGTTTTSVFYPVVGMFGEMVYARVFGNSHTSLYYPNSQYLVGSGSPRMRRHEMQMDKSLNRISIFLFCCLVLCLLLF
ncbi:PREDICTED: E3 ubiquitin-protein ligase RMA1H1-like [Nelumbo nucifera]|uniref:E3 ubiquitin-protein ligase RMA n=1 Tax=Nelumbo nucifera TaxID=4432 RepID=A0A1U8B861_NELNU|nr:PREDICTED: E3 ubiquitin-protein ligase RMA1H1-like [Nelumbo nucifera]